jgi:hypothetical protein
VRLRGVLFASYWVIAFIVLFLFSSDDTFCARPGARNYLIMTAQLALALAAYDLAVSVGVAAASTAAKKAFKMQWTSPLLTTVIVGSSLAYLPFWIYRGYGSFRFENTWADVSCFFTEGYGLSFPFVVVPVLTLATLLREVLILRFQRHRS